MHSWVMRLESVHRNIDPDGLKSRFIIVSGINTLFGLGIFPGLMWVFSPYHHLYMVLLAVSWMLATTFSFVTSKFLTFRTRGRYVSEFGKFSSFQLVVLAINLAMLPICVEMFNLPPVPLQFIFSLLVALLSYFWHRRVTFRSRSLPVDN